MYNPFVLLLEPVLDRLIERGVTYFVRQTYDRGRDHFEHNIKGVFLFSHYKDSNEAIAHFTSAIKYDPAKYLYNIHQPYDRERLYIAARQPEGYRIYVDVFAFHLEEWAPPEHLAKRMELYLRSMDWKPREGKISSSISVQTGTLYITFRRGREEMKVNLSEIEKF